MRASEKNELIENLIKAVSTEDNDALGKLYELIKTDVYAYCLSRLGNRYDAEDITEETFLKIHRYSANYSPCGKPLAWVFTIAGNLMKRSFELSSRSVGLESVENKRGTDFESSVCDNAFLQQLFALLDSEEREILTLKVVSSFKHREIAKLLQKPLSTVLSRYNRAIKKLKGVKF